MPSSSPGQGNRQTDLPSDSSGLFVRSSRSMGPGSAVNQSRRGDVNSENINTPRSRRRIFMDESGRVVREMPQDPSDAPTFSNIDPTTSDAQALGGTSTLCIWGTNVSMSDTMNSMKDFLRNFTRKYRMWLDGATEADTDEDPEANTKEYVQMMSTMLQLGTEVLNLDLRNLKAYPPTRKLWQQLIDYPSDVIPVIDQSVKDIMYELAETEMASQRQSQRTTQTQTSQRTRITSSEPPVPSSDRAEPEEEAPAAEESADVDFRVEVAKRAYKIRPFNMDQAVNMRELNPAGGSSKSFARDQRLIIHRCRQNHCYQGISHPNITHHPGYV